MVKLKNVMCFVFGMIVIMMLGATFQALMINGSGECSQNVSFTGQVAIGNVSAVELSYLDGVSLPLTTLLDAKQATITNNAVSDGSAAGQLKIWDATAGTWDNATLTQGSNITITNEDGSITIAASGSGLPSGTQGDILYYNGSAWVVLNAGTSGYFLKTQGAAANPIWASTTASAAGTLLVEDSGFGLDNSSVGRGTVGTKAVSLEYSDSGTTYGATADYTVVGGGLKNTSSYFYATVAGGRSNTASAGYATVAGGYSNQASGLHSAVGGGTGNSASGSKAVVAGGNDNVSSGDYSAVLGGQEGYASHHGETAFSSGEFTGTGDCQRGSVQARIATSSTSQTELFLDGTSEQFTLADGDAYSCNVTVMGKQADGSCGTAIYHVLIKREGSTTSLTGSVQTILAWYGDAGLGTPTWTLEADDTNEALAIKVTAANATATRWTAVVKYVKLNY